MCSRSLKLPVIQQTRYKYLMNKLMNTKRVFKIFFLVLTSRFHIIFWIMEAPILLIC